MAKKSKSKFKIIRFLPILCGIGTIAMFTLVFLKSVASASALGQTVTTTVTMTGWSLIFGSGEVKSVVETTGLVNSVTNNTSTLDDAAIAILPLIGFICFAIATLFVVLALFAPKKCLKASYLGAALLFVAGVVLSIFSKDSFISANESYKALFEDGGVSLGVCFSGAFALGGAATSLLSLK